jgi:hypothetical protein
LSASRPLRCGTPVYAGPGEIALPAMPHLAASHDLDEGHLAAQRLAQCLEPVRKIFLRSARTKQIASRVSKLKGDSEMVADVRVDDCPRSLNRCRPAVFA